VTALLQLSIPAVSFVVPPAVGYLCGALPWGLWLGRWFKHVDVRAMGSGNLGATNVYRSLGPALGITTLALDIAKGVLPTWLLPQSGLAAAWPSAEWCRIAVALAAVAGHMWTCFAGFKGGKGVATTVGALLAIAPLALGIFVAVFVVAVAITRYISVGSILGALAFAIALWFLSPGGPASPTFLAGALLAALVIARHRDNILRLARRQERRFSFKGGKS
jgi:glycerol-3-phosphate acyltransferase PlsY